MLAERGGFAAALKTLGSQCWLMSQIPVFAVLLGIRQAASGNRYGNRIHWESKGLPFLGSVLI